MFRSIVLFDKVLGGSTKAAGSPLRDLVVSCASTTEHLILATNSGWVYLLNENYTLHKKFQAYQTRVDLLALNREENVLVTVGNDEDTISPRVKWWDLNVWDSEGYPILFNEITVESQMLASCLVVASDLQTTIVGLHDGNMIVVSGHPRKLRVLRQKELPIQAGNPITGLYISKSLEEEILYVVTHDLVQSYKVHTGNIFKEKDLDMHGCELGCGAITGDNRLCLARKEGFFFYTATGKAGAHSYDSTKKLFSWSKNYGIVLEVIGGKTKLSIFDITERYSAFSHNFDASHIEHCWGKVIVLTKDGGMFYLTEKEIGEKLEIAMRKNLYEVAISMATNAEHTADQVGAIYLQYGDHLYGKGSLDEAMKQYRQTIGCTTILPSSIIKKYLDSSQNNNLTQYLEDLHEKGEATANHTTLLFNCYTKRKEFAKISAFLKRQELVFDYSAVIRVCREAGYHDFALQLAKRKKITEWHLKILVEDFKKFEEALAVIRTLEFEQAQYQIKKFGKLLLMELPFETTKFLMELCTDYVPVRMDDQKDQTKEEEKGAEKQVRTKLRANPEDFIRIFTNQPKQQQKFLEYVVANQVGTKKKSIMHF